MASASSSVARLFLRDGKSAANLLTRARAATDRVTNPVPAIRSLLQFNTTPAYQYPILTESFPVMQSRFHVGFNEQEATLCKMKAGVVDNESGDSEEELDFDEEEFDDLDISDDEELDDIDEDDDDEEEEEKYTKKNKK